MTDIDADVQRALDSLDGAYIVEKGSAAAKRAKLAFHAVAAKGAAAIGEPGISALLSRLSYGMTVQGGMIDVKNMGDYTWNELLKKALIIRTLGAVGAQQAAPMLNALVSAESRVAQVVPILRPAAAEALKGIRRASGIKWWQFWKT